MGSYADASAVSAGGTGGLSFSVISIAAAVVAIATKTTAPSRARVLESMVVPSVSTVEEHSGIARLIAGPGREKATTLLARSEEHTSELQSLMRISYAVFCLKKKELVLKSNYITSTKHKQAR